MLFSYIAYIFSTIVIFLILYRLLLMGLNAYRTIVTGKKTSPFNQIAASGHSRILVVGDSTAYGVGASTADRSVIGLLAQDLPNFTIVNAAENGSKLAQTYQKIMSLPELSFDSVIILTGGIDTISLTSQKTMTDLLQQTIEQLKKVCTNKVFLVSVNNVGATQFFPYPLNLLCTYRSRQITELCGQVASKNQIVHIPLFLEKDQDPFYASPKKFISYDGIHPNDEGYKIWYDKIAPIIREHLSRPD